MILGDCLEVLSGLPSSSVDSMVTDPPAGIGFMGKEWDKDKGGGAEWVNWLMHVMEEALRVLKPGAHGLVWALPRTSHRTAAALENAGFEIRDVITHVFGTGFPKSLDISKAIDKAAGAEREVVGEYKGTFDTNKTRVEQGYRPKEVKPGAVTSPATPDAKQWQGWGTALKPASEHWLLVRKPLSEGTVAANVLEHGTGGLNIEGSRIGAGGDYTVHNAGSSGSGTLNWNSTEKTASSTNYRATSGRFPANFVLSHNEDCEDTCAEGCAVAVLDEQSLSGGMHSAGTARYKGEAKQSGEGALFGMGNHPGNGVRLGDTGGASRFFYCSKASKSDRSAGNTHPTVKSTKLMGYLCRLVTPPGGTILDPFMGSGSTGVAAIREGFKFLGIEKEQEYFDIAKARIDASS